MGKRSFSKAERLKPRGFKERAERPTMEQAIAMNILYLPYSFSKPSRCVDAVFLLQ